MDFEVLGSGLLSWFLLFCACNCIQISLGETQGGDFGTGQDKVVEEDASIALQPEFC